MPLPSSASPSAWGIAGSPVSKKEGRGPQLRGGSLTAMTHGLQAPPGPRVGSRHPGSCLRTREQQCVPDPWRPVTVAGSRQVPGLPEEAKSLSPSR